MANPSELAITDCVRNGSVAQPTASAIDTNGTVLIKAKGLTDRILIEVDNAAGAILDVTIKGGINPPAHLSRDLVVSIPATTGHRLIGPFESQRFAKANGDIDVQFQAASSTPNAAVRIYRLPRA